MARAAAPPHRTGGPGTDEPAVTAALAHWAAEAPDRTAYVFLAEGEEEQERLTYGAIDARARAIAAALGRSLAPGERALLLYPPGLDFVSAFFGCLYAGVIAVPAYPPRSPRTMPRLLALLADALPAMVLAPAASVPRVRGWLARMPEAAAPPWLATDEVEPAPAGWEPAAPEGGAVAFLQYTSGSTSTPKGVMVTHDNLRHNLALIRDACGHGERSVFVSWLPLYHDLGLIGNLLQSAFVGASCVLMAPAAFLKRPVRWLAAVSRYGGTTSGGPDFAWDLCARKVAPGERRQLDLSCWEIAFSGAEPVRAATLDRFAAAFAECGFRPGAFYPCYGLAEATLMVAGGRPGEEPSVRSFATEPLAAGRAVAASAEEARQSRLVSCGTLHAGQELAIVDPAKGRRRGPGEVGEIWLSGPSVAAGYWRRPEESAAAFGARLEDGTGPFLRTGDLGFVDGGELFIAGRLKDLIILRGRNHYPQDLEATAAASHPAFAGGFTAAFSVERRGEERLVLVQELRPRSAVDLEVAAEAIRRAVAEEHEAQVEEIVLVAAGALPRTSSGKVQRGRCRDLLLSGELEVRAQSVLAAAEEEAEPVRSREELLALPEAERHAVLADWLRRRLARAAGIAPARLRIDSPLHELGLDSLAAAEVKNELEEGLGIALPLTALLESPSVEQLAQAGLDGIAVAAPAPVSPAVPGSTEELPLSAMSGSADELPLSMSGSADELSLSAACGALDELPLSYVQEAIWFLQRLAPESAAYNVSFAARLPPATDPGALARSLQGLVARHAALRTTFGEREGRPFQREGPPPETVLAEVDDAGWSEEELLAHATEEANRPFDLAAGPVLRAALYRGGAGGPVLLLTVHHLAIDGRSFWRLIEELGERYRVELAGGTPAPPPAAGYRDFVAWQRALIHGPEGERLSRFWRRLGGTPALELPADRPRGNTAAARRGATVRFLVDEPLTRALRGLAATRRTTLFTVVLAAFEALLYRWSGQEDFLLGTAVWGRGRRELEDVVGCFFNVVPLAATVEPGLPFDEHLRRVQAEVRGALEHQDYPSHLLAGDLAAGPGLFQAVLLWQRPQWVGGASELTAGETGWRLAVHGLTLEPLPVERRFSRQELELEVIDAGEALAAALHYDADLFTAATAARMARHLQNLLAAAAADPEAALCDLRLLDAEEERRLLRDLNRAERTYALPFAVHDLFTRQAGRTPDRTAAVGPWGALTYGELDARSDRLAALIRRVTA
jgi:acyl-CoA synthetase (AMP-forming)/AMP-acid ligase II/acyl carrier protein